MFAVSRISWIKKQKKNFENQARQKSKAVCDWRKLLCWGKRYRLDVQYSNIRNEVRILGGNVNIASS